MYKIIIYWYIPKKHIIMSRTPRQYSSSRGGKAATTQRNATLVDRGQHTSREVAPIDTITRRQPTTRQAAAPHHYSYRKSCPGRGKHAHNRNECSAWGKQCMKCSKSNHFANVYRSTMTNTHLVANTTQLADDVNLCDETYALSLYKCNTATTDRHIIILECILVYTSS